MRRNDIIDAEFLNEPLRKVNHNFLLDNCRRSGDVIDYDFRAWDDYDRPFNFGVTVREGNIERVSITTHVSPEALLAVLDFITAQHSALRTYTEIERATRRQGDI